MTDLVSSIVLESDRDERYPHDWQLPDGRYRVQAVARRAPAADLVSEPIELRWPRRDPVELRIDRELSPGPFPATDRVTEVSLESELLSRFHSRVVTMRAGVVRPRHPKRDAPPVVYWIPGFDADHRLALSIPGRLAASGLGEALDDTVFVVLDPSWPAGHHLFADSARNGPWSRALVEELIPAIEAQCGGHEPDRRRYLAGMSSGGWSSLWLQLRYPTVFRGAWAHSPDPVDFRAFLGTDIYAPGANLFLTRQGEPELVYAPGRGGTPITFEAWWQREQVIGAGGQLQSYDAVFGSADGASLFDATGAVRAEVAARWRRYDLSERLRGMDARIRAQLAGKLHVYAGSDDPYGLDAAVALFGQRLEAFDGCVAEVVDGLGHAIHADGLRAMFEAIAAERR